MIWFLTRIFHIKYLDRYASCKQREYNTCTKISKQKSFSNKEYFLLNSILFKIVSISEIHLAHFEREEKDKREKGIKRIKEEIIFPTVKIHFSLRSYRPKIKQIDSSLWSPIEAPVTERQSIRNNIGRELQDKQETKVKDQRPVLGIWEVSREIKELDNDSGCENKGR